MPLWRATALIPGLIPALIPTLIVLAALIARQIWIDGKLAELTPTTQPSSWNGPPPPPSALNATTVLFLGDSRVAQWPQGLLPPPWTMVRHGKGGETTAALATHYQADVAQTLPGVVVIESGMNDLIAAAFLPPAQGLAVAERTAKTLRTLALDIHARGCRVILATVVPAGRPSPARLLVWSPRVRTLVGRVNRRLREQSWPPGVTVLDLAAVLGVADEGTLPERYRADSIHLNTTAYPVITAALAAELARP